MLDTFEHRLKKTVMHMPTVCSDLHYFLTQDEVLYLLINLFVVMSLNIFDLTQVYLLILDLDYIFQTLKQPKLL